MTAAPQVRDWLLDDKILAFLKPWSEGGQGEGSNEFIAHCLGEGRPSTQFRARVDAAVAGLLERGLIRQTCTGRYQLAPKRRPE